MSFSLDGLNPEQLEAVTAGDGPLLLLAGAGTGKTRVITYRVAHLISCGISPGNILAVTFTNKAAREMSERLASILGRETTADLTVCTFHSFCARLLRRKIRLLGYNANFDIAPQGYQVGLVKSILGEAGLGDGNANVYHAMISRAKSRLLLPEDIAEESRDWPAGFRLVYELYRRRMKNMDSVDFDDLLLLTVQLWKTHPEVLDACRDQYSQLLIDEYQDTNAAQFRLMALLAGDTRNICAVGDDDQSIYGWRGADVGNILSFAEHFPGAKVIRLEQNYRSTNNILAAANAVISHNPSRHGKRLWSARGDGSAILCVPTETEEEEAAFVADLVRERTCRGGTSARDIAILYRSNAQSRTFESVLRNRRIPYRLVGAKSFYERREVLDALSYLKLVNNPRDDLSLLRIINVPPRGMGDRSVARLRDLAAGSRRPLERVLRSPEFLSLVLPDTAANLRQLGAAIDRARSRLDERGSLRQLASSLLETVGYLSGLARIYKPREDALRRRDNVLEFINSVAEYEERMDKPSLQDFLERYALMDDSDRVSEEGDEGVTLMTVHSAKGLEFPIVVLAGMEQGLFPHRQSLEERSTDEERRLFYVAMTRARDELVITHAARRRVRGVRQTQRPSVFLSELPENLLSVTDPDGALQPASPEEVDDFMAAMKAQFSPPS